MQENQTFFDVSLQFDALSDLHHVLQAHDEILITVTHLLQEHGWIIEGSPSLREIGHGIPDQCFIFDAHSPDGQYAQIRLRIGLRHVVYADLFEDQLQTARDSGLNRTQVLNDLSSIRNDLPNIPHPDYALLPIFFDQLIFDSRKPMTLDGTLRWLYKIGYNPSVGTIKNVSEVSHAIHLINPETGENLLNSIPQELWEGLIQKAIRYGNGHSDPEEPPLSPDIPNSELMTNTGGIPITVGSPSEEWYTAHAHELWALLQTPGSLAWTLRQAGRYTQECLPPIFRQAFRWKFREFGRRPLGQIILRLLIREDRSIRHGLTPEEQREELRALILFSNVGWVENLQDPNHISAGELGRFLEAVNVPMQRVELLTAVVLQQRRMLELLRRYTDQDNHFRLQFAVKSLMDELPENLTRSEALAFICYQYRLSKILIVLSEPMAWLQPSIWRNQRNLSQFLQATIVEVKKQYPLPQTPQALTTST